MLRELKLSAKLADAVRASLSTLSAFKLTDPNGFELSIDIKKLREQPLTDDLIELFLQLGSAAKAKRVGIAFFLDEIQFVKEPEFRALISALQRAMQKQFGTLELTQGYPFYIQEFGKHIWNLAAASPITRDDVDRATPAPRSHSSAASTRFASSEPERVKQSPRHRWTALVAALGRFGWGSSAPVLHRSAVRRWPLSAAATGGTAAAGSVRVMIAQQQAARGTEEK